MNRTSILHSCMDLEKFQNRYQNISRDELERMWNFGYCEHKMKALNGQREKMKTRGREHVVSVPLVQVLSVHVTLDENKPLAIYGRIYGEYDHITDRNEIGIHDIYNRGCNEPEIINQNGNLTLTGPDASFSEFDVCMPLHKTTIVVDLWDADQKAVFSQSSFMVEGIAENEYEQVKLKVIPAMAGSVVVRYIAMPFATLYQVMITAFHKGYKKEGNRQFVNVNGKIGIRYDNTYGNYSSEEYTIFEKPNSEFEPLEVNTERRLRQSRYWIGVPAYSLLVVDCDLWDFDTKRNIIKETLKFPTHLWFGYCHTFTVDDVAIDLRVVNYKVFSQEEFEDESDQDSADMCDDDESSSSSDINAPWTLRPHRIIAKTSPLLEVFSVFIGHEQRRPLRLFGVIEALCGRHTFDIFRRQEDNAVELLENENILPLLEGNGGYDCTHSLIIMFDLKDVTGRVFIKGYVKWRKCQFDYPWWYQQLCSVIPGEHGFAAVHYTFSPIAVHATIDVFFKITSSCCDVSSPLIYGSVVAQYNYCEYSSRYTRDYYRKVLFKRNYKNPLQVASDMKLALDRSVVVVPGRANLIIEVDLWSVGLSKCLSHVFEIEIGCPTISVHKKDFSLEINLKWSNAR